MQDLRVYRDDGLLSLDLFLGDEITQVLIIDDLGGYASAQSLDTDSLKSNFSHNTRELSLRLKVGITYRINRMDISVARALAAVLNRRYVL